MRIAVIGSGYVGLVAGACFAELGHRVVLVDNDPEKLAALQRGEVPIHEQYLPELLARHRGNRLSFADYLPDAVRASDIVFIAVGTPQADTGEADMSYVEGVAREIAISTDAYKIVVDKSTVPVYTADWVRRVMLLNGASPHAFDVASNPEFLREGTAVSDFLYPDRIVIGADAPRCTEVLRAIYAPLVSGEYYRGPHRIPEPGGKIAIPRLICTSAHSAELIKHASNAFLAMKISFINAVANLCEAVGADIDEVRAGIGADARIGDRFLAPGIGYGGSCFPKDVAAFRVVARENGCDFGLLEQVETINEEQRRRFVRKLRNMLWTLKGKTIAVLGLAFKGGTDDTRESPAIKIVQDLLAEGCRIVAYDPAATANAARVLGDRAAFAASPYEAAAQADALAVLTDWEEFKRLDLAKLRHALRYPIVLDGRNLFSPPEMAKHGFIYASVGRPEIVPAPELVRRSTAAASSTRNGNGFAPSFERDGLQAVR